MASKLCEASTTTPPLKGGVFCLFVLIAYRLIKPFSSSLPHKNFIYLFADGNNFLTSGKLR